MELFDLQLFGGRGGSSGGGGGRIGKFEDTKEFGEKYANYLFEKKDGHDLVGMKNELHDYFELYKEVMKEAKDKNLSEWERERVLRQLGDDSFTVIDKNGTMYFIDGSTDIPDVRKHLRSDSIRYVSHQSAYDERDSIGYHSDSDFSKTGNRISDSDNAKDGYYGGVEKKFGVKKTYRNEKSAKKSQEVNKLISEYKKKYGKTPSVGLIKTWSGD